MNFSKLQVLRLEGNEISAGDMPSEATLCLRLATDIAVCNGSDPAAGGSFVPSNFIISEWHEFALTYIFIVGKFIVPWDIL